MLWTEKLFLNSLELSFSISQKCKNCTGSVTSNWDGAKNEMKWAPISPLEDEQKMRPEASKHQKVAPDVQIVTSTTSSSGVITRKSTHRCASLTGLTGFTGLTSHHITSHHITSHHLKSHHITSNHITSHHITLTSHHIISPSHHITSNQIT